MKRSKRLSMITLAYVLSLMAGFAISASAQNNARVHGSGVKLEVWARKVKVGLAISYSRWSARNATLVDHMSRCMGWSANMWV